MLSVEDRLERAILTLALASVALDNDNQPFTPETTLKAAAEATAQAHEDLYWVKEALSAEVLKQDAPTDDERDRRKRREAAAAAK